MPITVHALRSRVVTISLVVIGVCFVFFVIAPFVGLTSLRDDPWRLPQLILPVFVGYLAVAATFAVRGGAEVVLPDQQASLVRQILYGVFGLFSVLAIVLIAVYVATNHPAFAEPGSGMSMETIAAGFAILVSILSLTASTIIAYLFSVSESELQGKVDALQQQIAKLKGV